MYLMLAKMLARQNDASEAGSEAIVPPVEGTKYQKGTRGAYGLARIYWDYRTGRMGKLLDNGP